MISTTRGAAWVPATLALLAAPSLAAAAPCDVTGTVHGADGQPIPNLPVRLEQAKAPRHTTTDAEGRFRFATVSKPATVVATLGDGGKEPRFLLTERGTPVELQAPVDPATSCEVTLGSDSPRLMAADLLTLHQGLRQGFALFDQLGIRRGPTLHVEVSDPVADPHAAYWVGTVSFNPTDAQPPRIVLGTAATAKDDPGAPDNREHHELGHHALATAFGALPRARDHLDGGGYHRNASSAGALTEGFAIFFAALVAREIQERPDAGRYRVEGSHVDLELDYRPWDLRGTESLAVASLLWDVVDGDREGRPSPLTVDAPAIVRDEGMPPLLVARVHNPSDAPVEHARVRVDAEGWAGTALVAPAVLPPGADGWLALPLPTAVAEHENGPAALRLRAIDTPTVADDDAVQVEPSELWTAMVELRSDRPEANGRLLDVADLYQALRGRLGAEIDPLFVAHGLHADPDGDREHDPTEPLGLTSHPGRTLDVDGQPQTWPDLIPRHRLTLPPALRLVVDVQPAEATLAVLVSGSAWGGYLATPDDDGRIRVLPPPAREGAAVSVVATAPGRRPAVIWHREAAALLAELEAHERPFLAARATLPDASDLGSAATATAGAPRWPRLTFLGGAIAVLMGLVLMGIGWPRLRLR